MATGGRGREWAPRAQRDVGQLVGNYPDTPVVLLYDSREYRVDQLVLVNDDDRWALGRVLVALGSDEAMASAAWLLQRFATPEVRAAMDAHVVKVLRAHERAEEAEEHRTLWDRRWVRITAFLGVLGVVAALLTAIAELAALLHRVQ